MSHDTWWRGLSLWYNDHDFLSAMDVFASLVERYLDESIVDIKDLVNDEGDSNENIAALMLFLAGCSLDGGEPKRARKYCLNCLRLCKENASLQGRAINELISTYEEDTEEDESWKCSRQVAEYAVQRKGLGTGWTHPSQRPGFCFPIPDQQPIYAEIPDWCKAIESHYAVIRGEFESLLESWSRWPRVGDGEHRDGAGIHDASVLDSGDWREIVLFGSGAQSHRAPRTCEILRRYAGDAIDLSNQGGGEIIFSLMTPKTHVTTHCASTNLRLTAHLGLRVPPKARIRIDQEWCDWQEGKILVFDDSFEHEVVNDSDESRAVLLIRFWHPNVSKSDRARYLEQAVEWKELDRLHRYNPPLPDGTVLRRGLETDRCMACGSTGFESIRCFDDEMSCSCGERIGY